MGINFELSNKKITESAVQYCSLYSAVDFIICIDIAYILMFWRGVKKFSDSTFFEVTVFSEILSNFYCSLCRGVSFFIPSGPRGSLSSKGLRKE